MLRSFIRIVVYSLLGAVVIVLVGLYLAWRNTPAWYQPAHFSQEQLQEATTHLNTQVTGFQNDVNYEPAGRPIVVTLSQDRLNSYLQALPLYDPRAKLPAGLVDPLIVLKNDKLILAGRIPKLSNRPVSLHIKMRIEPDRVAVAIDSVNVGSLPLPKQFVEDQLAELRHKLDAAAGHVKSGPHPRAGQAELVRLGQSFFAALGGEPMSREFETPKLKRKVRLDKLELTEGQLRLTFMPQGPAAERPVFDRPEMD